MKLVKKWGPYLIFFAAMLWATDAPFRLHLTQGLSSNFIVLGEHTIDVLCVLPILLMGFSEVKKLGLKEWGAVLVIAIGGSALASVAFTQAFHYVNPSVAILLQKLQPLIAIALAAAILKEASEMVLREIAKKQEMVTMQEDGILKVLLGQTSFKEVEGATGEMKW